jgi:hypothetical protein
MADLVDALFNKPGLYVGVDTAPDHGAEGAPSVARIEVTPLPGGSGVVMAYEVLSPVDGVGHHEHAVLARTTTGLVLVTSHSHAEVTTVLSESEPGYFPAAEGAAPFPMAIRLEVPEPGHLVYSWSYGWDQEPMKVRDVADVRLVG